MISLLRTDSANHDFMSLVKLLDVELAERDGADHPFYAQFNTIDQIKHALVAYDDGKPIACGAIKRFNSSSMEVKRMYVLPESRSRGIASLVLRELEAWSRELSSLSCVLETGKKQPEAIALYYRSGYHVIANYGQYAGIANSVCFEKMLA